MIAIDPSQRTIDSRWIETPHIDSLSYHLPPESAGGIAQTTGPVIHDSDLHILSGFFGKQAGKFPPHLVFMNDESFEVNPLFSGFDRCDPGRIVFGSVLEQLDAISGYEEGSRCTRKRFVG